MKKNYFKEFWLLMSFGLLSCYAVAQNKWHSEFPPTATTVAQIKETKTEPGTIYLGYTGPDAYIYPYDGLSLDFDAKVGVAIKLPRKKFAPYIGGKIEQLYLGWDTPDMTGQADAFIRTSFHSEDLAKGKGELTMGWNIIDLDKAFTIPDVDTLVVGYYTDLKKGVIAIPKVYPVNQEHSCYLWMEQDKTPDGNEIWYDSKDFGTMCILAMISDDEGKFNNLLTIENTRFDQVITKDSIATALVTLRNAGSNAITSVEITSEFNDKKWSMEVPLGKRIAASTSGRTYLPYNPLGSGKNKFIISKVNGATVKNPQSCEVNLISIPKEVSDKYKMNHLLEFWTSENSYMHITYFEEYTRQNVEKYKDGMTLVCQHADDQFMTGEEDDASIMMLDFVNNDSMRVFLPSMSLNRNRYVINRAADDSGPLFPVFFPEYGDIIFKDLMDSPTFASVNIDAQWAENKRIKVSVTGDVADNVLPKDEPLYLTVYLMEYDVESDSQIFWDEEQKVQYDGKYKHYNVIRQILTPVYGEKLEKTGGEYALNLDVDVDEYWNAEKLGIIAFLNRGIENSNFERQIINSCEKRISAPTGIENVVEESDKDAKVTAIYNMAGTRVNKYNGKGLYLVKTIENGKPIVRKVLVK